MIKRIDISDMTSSRDILHVQGRSYRTEAELIGSYDLPPLKDTIQTLHQCNESFYGYYEEDVLCGVISIEVKDAVINICRLFVDPTHFRSGIAQSLFSFIESQYLHVHITVTTATKNLPAIKFYMKNALKK